MLTFRSKAASTDYNRLAAQWSNCDKCPLHRSRSRIVHARGVLPCSVLFIGEGPGRTEDNLGYPFTGKAGRKQNEIIDHVQQALSWRFSHAFANLVACMPCDVSSDPSYHFIKLRPPAETEQAACRSRLDWLIQIASPQRVCLLGETAGRAFGLRKKQTGQITVLSARRQRMVPVRRFYHPSHLIRPGRNVDLHYQRTILELQEFLEDCSR